MWNSDNPYLNGNYAPWREEGDAFDLEVEGEIPRELAGALYRIGPNPHFKPRGRYHWFDGDGMVHVVERANEGLETMAQRAVDNVFEQGPRTESARKENRAPQHAFRVSRPRRGGKCSWATAPGACGRLRLSGSMSAGLINFKIGVFQE